MVWGVGVRGKRAASFIGYHRIAAFIDSNPALIGSDCNGKPIIDVKQYLTEYKDCILVVSLRQPQEIVEILERKGISSYFLFHDCPSEIYMGQLESIQEIPLPQIDYSRAAVYGGSLYSFLLWEHMKKKEIDIPIILDTDNADCQCLFSKVSNDIYLKKDVNVVLPDIFLKTVEENPELECTTVVDMYKVYSCVEKFFHPELSVFKNLHLGERCFIIGNGSSLAADDLDMLHFRQEKCFGMNGIPLIFNDTAWRPHYYVIEDIKAMDYFSDLICQCNIHEAFIADVNQAFLKRVASREKYHVFHLIGKEFTPNLPCFSEDFEKGIYTGKTVTYACIQIAAYMGFRKIYLLGIDFDYAEGETMQVKHFSERYHMDPKAVNPSAKHESLLAYQSAKNYADTHGIEIYNATRGGALEVFPRVDFDELMA